MTVLFANFAEAIAEGRSKAQADLAQERPQGRHSETAREAPPRCGADATPSANLRKGDVVLVEKGDLVPGDGEVIEGVASINESAITGESAPVIREAAATSITVTGGTLVLVGLDRRADQRRIRARRFSTA